MTDAVTGALFHSHNVTERRVGTEREAELSAVSLDSPRLLYVGLRQRASTDIYAWRRIC